MTENEEVIRLEAYAAFLSDIAIGLLIGFLGVMLAQATGMLSWIG